MLSRLAATLASGLLAAIGVAVLPAGTAYASNDVACDNKTEDDPPDTTTRPSAPLDQLHIAAAHDLFTQAGKVPGNGVTVAVVDSGVADTDLITVAHADRPEFPPVFPSDYHGTVVAGLIAGGETDSGPIGIAPGATVLDVKVYDSEQPSTEGEKALEPSEVIDGLEWVAQRAKVDPSIKVVNISLAMQPSAALRKAVKSLLRQDIVVVTASGNRPQDETDYGFDEYGGDGAPAKGEDAARDFFPAGYPEVLTVNASALAGVDVRGEVLLNSQTDVAAPPFDAVSVDLRGGTCRVGIATSWATAQVSGTVAMLRSWYPDETGPQIVARLKTTANGLEPDATADGVPVGASPLTGAGVIQPMEALTRQLTVSSNGAVVRATDADPQLPAARAPAPEVDPLGSMRDSAIWWGLLSGGAIVLALLMRPIIGRLRRS